ncbi:MAG: coagulation factor 5/8 type protein [Rhodocyclales bacterium]|nr:coagulation factor 5/8 type protein [Rhodocyclales bacterium]
MNTNRAPALRRLSLGLLLATSIQAFAVHQAQAVTVDLQVKSTSSSSYTTDVVIKNDTTAAINGWTLSFKLGNTIKSVYSTTVSGSDPYTFKNASFNGSIAVGKTVSFGFTANGTLNGANMGNCTINGAACTLLIGGKPIGGASSSAASSKASSAAASSKASSSAAASSKASSSAASSAAASSKASSSSAGGVTYNVTDGKTLIAALAKVNPGDTVVMANGTYSGKFIITRSGSRGKPITLRGSSSAILDSTSSYGLTMTNANYWRLSGFTVANATKGIVMDTSSNNVLENLTVHDISQEGIHFRTHSKNNVLQNSRVYNIGLTSPGTGEGVYLGSANSNWGTYTGGKPDLSNNNCVANNVLGPNIASEPIDVKEGTTGGLIFGNTVDVTGISGENSADSFIDVKGDNYLIYGNTVRNPNKAPFYVHGVQTHGNIIIDTATGHTQYGNNNRFYNNNLDMNNATGYGFTNHFRTSGNVWCSNNTVTNAGGRVAANDTTGGFVPFTPPSCAAIAAPQCADVLNQ